MIYKISLT